MVKQVSSKKERPANGKGKQTKQFLNKDAALDLAAVIAGAQEEKALSRVEKTHQIQGGQSRGADKPKVSASKAKLKETKALIAAQRTHNKRERIKRKKQRNEEPEKTKSDGKNMVETRKKVSFA
ncbi:hypothetical protein H0H92_003713 [Tricholoma furcatifolium]|nr:hypothetical protein H0H92_003713 [Tricholoma furcatifolium]